MQQYQFILTQSALESLATEAIFFANSFSQIGNRLNSTFLFQKNTCVAPYSEHLAGQNLCNMGQFSYSWSPLSLDISIGYYSSIARGLRERPMNHPYERFTTSPLTYDRHAPLCSSPQRRIQPVYNTYKRERIKIEHDVWIGADTLISPGVTIHTGAIVATRSNVTKDVPPYHIVGGNPARLIKLRFPEKEIEALLASRWFEYDISVLPFKADIAIPDFLELFYEAKEKGAVTPFQTPKPFIEILQELHIPFEERGGVKPQPVKESPTKQETPSQSRRKSFFELPCEVQERERERERERD